MDTPETAQTPEQRIEELEEEVSLYRDQLLMVGQACYTLQTHGWDGRHVRSTDASKAA